jgi:hypothetical protein
METTMTAKVVMVLLTLSLSSLPLFFQDVRGQTQAGEQVGNQPPVADAGPDQRVNEGDLVSLNGSSSFDPDGEIISYAWGIEDSDDDAPPISLSGQNTSIATFTAPTIVGGVSANSYLFELTVTDNDGLMDTAASKIVVEKRANR